jgi:hypothetical protein
MPHRRSAVVLLVLLLTAACTRPTGGGELSASASDDWTRSYPLEAGQELQITNADGPITVEGTDGSTVEVQARRTVRARTDETAREVLPRVAIREDVDAKRVAIRTEPLGGIVIGVEVEVAYSVRAPKTAMLRLRASNGAVTVRGISGMVVASGVNGAVVAEGLSGGMELRSVNGNARVSVAEVGAGLIDIRATNGGIDLVVPETANATIQASATNGGFDVAGLNYTPLGENGPRRFRGRLNDGGALIELAAVNGKIRLASPTAKPAEPAPPAGPASAGDQPPPRR